MLKFFILPFILLSITSADGIDKCTNFYDFACSGQITKFKENLNPLNPEISVGHEVELDNIAFLSKKMGDIRREDLLDAPFELKVYDLYSSCKNRPRNKIIKYKRLCTLLKDFTGIDYHPNRRMLEKDLDDRKHYLETILSTLDSIEIGNNGLFVATPLSDLNSVVIEFKPLNTKLLLDRYYKNDTILKHYHHYIYQLMAPLNITRAEARRIMMLEQELVEASSSPEEVFEGSMTQWDNGYKCLNWTFYYDELKKRTHISKPLAPIFGTYSAGYFKVMCSIVEKYKNDKLTLYHYMIYHMLDGLVMTVPDIYPQKASHPVTIYFKELITSEYEYCIKITNKLIPNSISYFYNKYRKFEKEITEALKIVGNIKKALVNHLTKHSRFDFGPVINQMGNIDYYIGLPDVYKNYSYMAKITHKVRVANKNFYKSFLYNQKIVNKNAIVSPDVFALEDYKQNAFSFRNISIMLHHTFLQEPFFSTTRSSAKNYGGFGVILAHEMLHSLNYIVTQGADEEMAAYVKNKSDCYVERYSEFGENGIKMDGKRTLGENIADSDGLKLAYKAYKSATKPKERNYDEFFMQFAKVQCSLNTKDSDTYHFLTDEHPLPKYRVSEATRNFKEFNRQYKCKVEESTTCSLYL